MTMLNAAKKLKLEIELVPETLWFRNLRSELSPEMWNLIKKASGKQYGWRCAICSGRGKSHWVECHEIWSYDDVRRVQTLAGVISLCPDCHKVKHYGFACSQGKEAEVFAHFCRINDLSEETGVVLVREYFSQWTERSRHEDWTVDFSWIDKFIVENQLAA